MENLGRLAVKLRCAMCAAVQDVDDNRRGLLWVVSTLVTVTLVLYWPATEYGFVVVDDPEYITENPWVAQGLNLSTLKWAFTATYASNWHPLTWITHMLDQMIYGHFAGGHHLTNIILHALNVLLVFVWLKRWTGALWRSAIVAAFFGWHPLRVESVAWVAERKDVLSTLFMLLTLIAYGKYVLRPTPVRCVLALCAFALGLMAKPMLVTLPFVLVLLDYWPLGRVRPVSEYTQPGQARAAYTRILFEKLPFLCLSAASCAVTLYAQRTGGALKTVEEIPVTMRLFNSLAAYVQYLGKTFWPDKLCVYYPLPAELPILVGVFAAVVLLCISYVAFRWRQRCPWLFVGWFWFLGTLVPVIGLVQVGHQAMADRYTYIPSIGLFLALVWCTHYWLARWRFALRWCMAFSGVLLLCCLWLTREQLAYWRNSITLLTRAVSVTRDNAYAHLNLGVALADTGQTQEAVLHYKEALRIRPNYVHAHNNLGVALTALGQFNDAMYHYTNALRLNPNSELVYNNLGALLAQQGQYELAIEHFNTAIKLNPHYPKPYFNLAFAMQKLGQPGTAVTNYTKALELDPAWPEALDKLAYLLAACPDRLWHNPSAAVKLAERAVRLTKSEVPDFIETLAFAYATCGNFSNAQAMAELAWKKANEKRLTQLAERLSADLEFYRAGQTPPKDWRNPM